MTFIDVTQKTTKPIAEIGKSEKKKDKYLEEHRKEMLKEAKKLGQRRALA